jgi:hypothetical protein
MIDDDDERAVQDAVVGREFRRSADALKAAERAFVGACDRAVRTARIRVVLRSARGDRVELG